jgi:hypothetical protein
MSDKSSTLAYVNENEQKTDQTSKWAINVEVRRRNYIIRAPQSGYACKVTLTGIGEIVKEGQALRYHYAWKLQLAVELYVSANDVPLLNVICSFAIWWLAFLVFSLGICNRKVLWRKKKNSCYWLY